PIASMARNPPICVEELLESFISDFELFPNFVVKVLQQLAARLRHRLIDLQAEFELKLIERDFDFLVLAAALVDVVDALLEVHAAFNRTQHFIARAKDPLEQLELLREQ